MASKRPPALQEREAAESMISDKTANEQKICSAADRADEVRTESDLIQTDQSSHSFIYTICKGFLDLCYSVGKHTIETAAVLRSVAKNLWDITLSESFDRVSSLLFKLSEYQSSRAGRGELSITRAIVRFFRSSADAFRASFQATVSDGPIEGVKLLAARAVGAQRRLWARNRKVFNALAPLAGVAILAATIYAWMNMGIGVMLVYNGVKVGVVSNDLEYHNAVSQIETRVASASGKSFKLNKSISYQLVFVNKSEFITTDKLYDNILMASGSVVSHGYGLYVDGRLIGSNSNGLKEQAMLDSILAPYKKDAGSATVGFVQNVEIKSGIFPTSVEKSVDSMKEALVAHTAEQRNYTVQKGDTPIKVASMFQLSLDQLYGMNPSVSKDGLYQGETVVVQSTQPMLTVKMVKNEVFEQDIPYGVDKTNSDSIYQGQTKVASAGINGKKQIIAAVTYINGVAADQKTLSETITQQPVNQQVLVGTKPKPSTMASGSFTWPCYASGGYISCGFWGYYGHTGVDYACNQGTPIHAADAGTVIFAGWEGGYGNCVKISHGNGFVTLYGHCSKLLVTTGQKVFKGQEISLVGHTGHVIGNPGNHVHFEIQVNGTAVNPLKYVRP